MLEVWFVNQVKKVKDFGAVDEFFYSKCEYALSNGDLKRAQDLLDRICGYCKNGQSFCSVIYPKLNSLLGNSLMEAGLYSTAYKFLFKSRAEEGIVNCLIKVAPEGNSGERDLFVARAVLDMLSREEDIAKAQYIKRESMKALEMEQTPLLNFIDFVFDCIELEDFELFVQMTNEDYNS